MYLPGISWLLEMTFNTGKGSLKRERFRLGLMQLVLLLGPISKSNLQPQTVILLVIIVIHEFCRHRVIINYDSIQVPQINLFSKLGKPPYKCNLKMAKFLFWFWFNSLLILLMHDHLGFIGEQMGCLDQPSHQHCNKVDTEQARKSSEDTQAAGYTRLEKVCSG